LPSKIDKPNKKAHQFNCGKSRRAGAEVSNILPFLKNETVFEPEATQAMSAAFEAACQALQLSDGAAREREAVAVRIIELARRGERDPLRLSQSVLRDAGAA
jgi:hypothetical protein